jgi:hypothetical protein
MLKKKIWASFQRIIELFTQKFVTKLSKIWVWNPRSGKNLFWIPDPGLGVKKALDPGSRIRILNTGVLGNGHTVTRTNASIEVWVMFPEPASHGVLIRSGAVQSIQLFHILLGELEVPDVQVGFLPRFFHTLWHQRAILLQAPPVQKAKR